MYQQYYAYNIIQTLFKLTNVNRKRNARMYANCDKTMYITFKKVMQQN